MNYDQIDVLDKAPCGRSAPSTSSTVDVWCPSSPWSGTTTGGALYAELRKLPGEALIRAVREEQVERRPARTVFEITEEGRLELACYLTGAILAAQRR